MASTRLAQRHAEIVESHDERSEAAKVHADDLQHRLTELQTTAGMVGKRVGELLQQIQTLTADRDQARSERDALKIVAMGRQRVISQLVLGPAGVSG